MPKQIRIHKPSRHLTEIVLDRRTPQGRVLPY